MINRPCFFSMCREYLTFAVGSLFEAGPLFLYLVAKEDFSRKHISLFAFSRILSRISLDIAVFLLSLTIAISPIAGAFLPLGRGEGCGEDSSPPCTSLYQCKMLSLEFPVSLRFISLENEQFFESGIVKI